MTENFPLYLAAAFTLVCMVIHFSERYAAAVTAVLGFSLLSALLFGSMLYADHEDLIPRNTVMGAQMEGLGAN